MFCSACGNKVKDTASFCDNCGAKIENKATEPQILAENNPQQQEPAPQPSEKKSKKPNKKAIIVIAAVLLVILIPLLINGSNNYVVICSDCGNIEADWTGRDHNFSVCWDCFFNADEGKEPPLYHQFSLTYDNESGACMCSAILPEETFTIYSSIRLYVYEEKYDSISDIYYYEIVSPDDNNTTIDVEILPKERYNFEKILADDYEKRLGQYTFDRRTGRTACGYPMNVFYHTTEDGTPYFEFQMYSEEYFYTFTVHADTDEALDILYNNLNNLPIE